MYHWFRQHVVKKILIKKIESENQKADIFTKGLQGELFVSNRKLLCGYKPSYDKYCDEKYHLQN